MPYLTGLRNRYYFYVTVVAMNGQLSSADTIPAIKIHYRPKKHAVDTQPR
jgi:hypothetical protein